MNNEMNTALDNFGQKWEQLGFDCDELYDICSDVIDGHEEEFIVYRTILEIEVPEPVEETK
jgi:hypothetical protein